jgi:hydroxymethylglutaryl-CoA lyase
MKSAIRFIECPRDAMQGWKHQIPTAEKIRYLNALLQAGFHTLDFGSFVSPKAIPQMADTKDVIPQLNMSGSSTKLLAIVANTRGAEDALLFDEISYLGFPFSISPTFQLRNTNSTMAQSLERVEDIQNLCIKNRRQLVVYLSMGFGNPYGDAYDESILLQWAHEMAQLDIGIISLADTVGLATPAQITAALHALIPQYPTVDIGVHLHSTPANWQAKLEAAVSAGCKRFDGAILGIGGCPMADDELVGNMNTGRMMQYFKAAGIDTGVDEATLELCNRLAGEIFV